MHLVVAFTGSAMALISTGGTTSHLVSTIETTPPCRDVFACLVGGTFDGHRALTNELELANEWVGSRS